MEALNLIISDEVPGSPFPKARRVDTPLTCEQFLVPRAEHIGLRRQVNFWKAQHGRAKDRIEALEQELVLKNTQIKDLQNRLFGKKTEKKSTRPSEKDQSKPTRSRGHQKDAPGHGRTPCPNLPVKEETIDLPIDKQVCPKCGLPLIRCKALDECNEIKEIQVQAYIRRIHRPAYVRRCQCSTVPAVITAPVPARLIPRSPYGVSFWVETLLSKFQYWQPTHRLLHALRDQGLPVSPGTVAGGLKAIAPLFKPLVEALYEYQMNETLFHGDETRWEVFVVTEGKVGTRWYLWVFRSASVIYYRLEPSRSTTVPEAHFAHLKTGQIILVCDRYSAYKKLARISKIILLAFCWAHVRRDFLDAGRSVTELSAWALEWKERIGLLYHENHQRLEHWSPELSLSQQNEKFTLHHQALADAMEVVHAEAVMLAAIKVDEVAADGTISSDPASFSKCARRHQKKIAQSLLNHWEGLCIFLEHPEVPMDNNPAENAVRGPVTGRKNFYGSGSLWSAALAASLFTLFQTFEMWGIPLRHWLSSYLQACADNGGCPPENITPFLPWSLAETPRTAHRCRPPVSRMINGCDSS